MEGALGMLDAEGSTRSTRTPRWSSREAMSTAHRNSVHFPYMNLFGMIECRDRPNGRSFGFLQKIRLEKAPERVSVISAETRNNRKI